MHLIVGGTYEQVKTKKQYRLLAVAKDTHTLGEFVVYEALYENSVSKVWMCPKEEFLGEAQSPDGTFHPRFRLIQKEE